MEIIFKYEKTVKLKVAKKPKIARSFRIKAKRQLRDVDRRQQNAIWVAFFDSCSLTEKANQRVAYKTKQKRHFPWDDSKPNYSHTKNSN